MSELLWYTWPAPAFTRGSFTWETVTDGKLPEDAVECGLDKDGSKLYAGRAYLMTELLPAKLSCSPKQPDYFFAYVSSNGTEYKLDDEFEVLVSRDVAWMSRKDGEIPEQAIVIAQTPTGENLYYGRSFYNGTITPGKVHPSHKCLYIPYGDKEICIKNYEIMILL